MQAKQLIKPSIFILCLCPLLGLIIAAITQRLGVNPVETVIRELGIWALRFLVITLSVTPLRQLTGWQTLGILRRMLGLYAFFYALLHFLSYLWFDQFFVWQDILDDIRKRPFITIGFINLILMLPLVITSTNAMIKRLGGKHWRRLHQLVYVIGVGGVVHFWWLAQTKANLQQPLIYAIIVLALLCLRLSVIRNLIRHD